MSNEIRKYRKHKNAKEKINKLYEDSTHVLLIHYSCESFYDIKDGRTPRVTSIAIRNLQSAQTRSFSIHKVAECKNIDINNISYNYDELEKEMLDDFFDFLEKKNDGYYFVHWNMRDENYGFSAIEHRYKVLGGEPFSLSEDRKVDLARELIDIFGRYYIDHGSSGRLLELIKLNDFTDKGALTGKDEAEAFKNGDYIKLHQSTLRKVDAMSNIFEGIVNGTLKTNAKWLDRHGFHPKILVEFVKEHWIWRVIVILVTILGGTFTVLRLLGLN